MRAVDRIKTLSDKSPGGYGPSIQDEAILHLKDELIALWEVLQQYEDEVDLPDGLAIPLRALNDKAADL